MNVFPAIKAKWSAQFSHGDLVRLPYGAPQFFIVRGRAAPGGQARLPGLDTKVLLSTGRTVSAPPLNNTTALVAERYDLKIDWSEELGDEKTAAVGDLAFYAGIDEPLIVLPTHGGALAGFSFSKEGDIGQALHHDYVVIVKSWQAVARVGDQEVVLFDRS